MHFAALSQVGEAMSEPGRYWRNNVADLPYPAPMRGPLGRFPLGRARRLLMAPVYAALALGDL